MTFSIWIRIILITLCFGLSGYIELYSPQQENSHETTHANTAQANPKVSQLR